jgi:hypothetical protein
MVRKLSTLDPYKQRRAGKGFSKSGVYSVEETDYAFERIHRWADRITRDLELEFQEILTSASVPQVSILSQLNDVSVSTATDGQVLTYKSANNEWVPTSVATGGGSGSTITSLSQLNDVSVSTAVSGDILSYDGTEWVPRYGSGSFYWRAAVSTDQNNVTGDGTLYEVNFDQVYCDGDGNYNGSSGFMLAPVRGLYQVGHTHLMRGGSTQFVHQVGVLIHGSIQYHFDTRSTGGETHQGGTFNIAVTVESGVTISPFVNAAGGTKIVDVSGGLVANVFHGYLVKELP